MNIITQNDVKSLFTYNTGELYWKISPSKRVKIGDKVGSLNKYTGYKHTKINKQYYYVHRLIYLYHHGFLPEEVDHIDTDKNNNNITNLRKSTHQQNNWNQPLRKTNTTGHKGVSFNKKRNKYECYCCVDGKRYKLGYFDNLSDAVNTVMKFRELQHGEYARHG